MRKWILRVALALLLLLICSAAGFIYFIRKNYSPEKVKKELETAIRQKTGLDMSIGSLEFTWTGDIKLRQICIKNPLMKSERCLMAANITHLDLRILPLLKKRIEIRAAVVDDMALNLFVIEEKAANGKKTLLKSWEIPTRDDAVKTDTGAVAEMRLDSLKVGHGDINHEYAVLPLPLGKNQFSLAFSEGAEKAVRLDLEYANGGFTGFKLKVGSQNMLASLKRLLREKQVMDADTVSGEFECKLCNAGAFDRRLGQVTGKFNIAGANNKISLETKNTELGILNPVIGNFNTAAKFTVVLPTVSVQDGSGSLSATGLSATFQNFSVDALLGAKGDFDATLDFTAARGMLKLPANMTGVAHAHGRLEKGIASGVLRVKNFNLAATPGMAVTSPDFTAAFIDSRLNLTNQPFKLNEHSLWVTGTVLPGDISLRVSAEALQYEKWRVEKFTGNLRRTANQLEIRDASMIFARGRLTANYLRKADSKAQNLRLTAAGLKGQDLSNLFGLKATVFGDIGADATMNFSGDTADEMRRSLSGSTTLRIGRGKIKDSFFQKGMLGGPLHKLEEKFSDIEFASLTAEVAFQNGRWSARRLFFDAEEWNLTLRAEADAENQGKAALEFRFRPSFVENVANPLHLGIEGRKEGEFYELPFACRGNVLSGACYKQNW
jgi:AsmA-like C-terminal region